MLLKKKKITYFYIFGFLIFILVNLGLLKLVDRGIPFLERSIGEKSNTRISFEEKEPEQLLRFKGIKEPYSRNRYISYVTWGYKDTASPDSNIVGGYRRSYEHTCSLNQIKKTIWMFGGSTMLGQGSPDDFTIPSFLCKELKKKYPETCWRCENYGIGGYVFTQEIFLFIRFLQKENPRPDLVIFYDGVNDFIASLQGYPTEHHNFTKIRDIYEVKPIPLKNQLFNYLPNITRTLKRFLYQPGASNNNMNLIQENLLKSSKIYKFNFHLLNNIGLGENLKIIAAFQPTVFSKIPLSEYEQWHLDNYNYTSFTNKELRPLWDFYYLNVMKQNLGSSSNTSFVDLTQTFNEANHSIFYNPGDWMHVNWNGNIRVAKALSEVVTTHLEIDMAD